MKTIVLNTLETAMNRYLQSDTQSLHRLQKMAGKSISIELFPLNLHFNCRFTAEHVSLDMNEGEAAQTTIKGSPLQLLGALVDKNNRHQFFADDLTIEGDAEFAQEVIALFDQVHIDWEEQTSRLIGDVPAYQLSKFLGGIRQWVNTTQASITEDVSDYLHEEATLFPAKEQLDEFFNDIDTLRMDADRLETRITNLASQLNNKEAP
jgi:ubiquinone biosynthesis protein UbiJ